MSIKCVKAYLKPAAATVILSMALTTQTVAETAGGANFVEQVGGEQRINFSGKLRMLSQRIPAAACNLSAGVVPSSSRAVLDGAMQEFEEILTGLEHGDDGRGIFGPEDRHRTLRVIEEVHKVYDPIKTVLDAEATGDLSRDAAQVLADQNMELLGIAKLLVSELTGQYANPVALTQSNAITIDIAGRQRMLTQKMSKEVCLILSDMNAEGAKESLGGTINMFEVSLGALRNGMDQVGINPPPNQQISEGLALVQTDWKAIAPQVQAVLNGEILTTDQRAIVFEGLTTTLKDMNAVVGMYAEASKQNL